MNLEHFLAQTGIYLLILVLFMVGLYGVINKKNLLKKLMSVNIVQVSVIIFFLSIGQKHGASVPVLEADDIANASNIMVENYINPLPQAMMLTAIVVSLAIAGVGLVLLKKIAWDYKTIEEDEIVRKLCKNPEYVADENYDAVSGDERVNDQTGVGGESK